MKTLISSLLACVLLIMNFSKGQCQVSYNLKFKDKSIGNDIQFNSGKKKLSINNSDNFSKEILTLFNSLKVVEYYQKYPSAAKFDHPLKDEILKVYTIQVGDEPENFKKRLMNSGLFESVKKEETVPVLTYIPNDFSLSVPEQNYLEVINAKQAWDISKGSSSIKIAVIDNGFDPVHEDLIDDIDYTDGDVSYYGSGNSHGTATAGAASADTDNNKGIASIGFNSKLMLYKGISFAYDHMLDASSRGAKVISNSYITRCNTPNSTEQQIINMITDQGTLVVASAGNHEAAGCYGDWDGDGVDDWHGYAYPASYNNVLSIGGTDTNDSYFDDLLGRHLTFNDKVDLTAPGWSINSTGDDDQYYSYNGTSFSTPFVAGTAALMFSLRPCLTPYDVMYLLKVSADSSVNDLSVHPENEPFIDRAGAGRLDAHKALSLTQNYPSIIGNYASISGPSFVCSSNTTFALANAPKNAKANWTATPASLFTIDSESNSSYFTTSANTNSKGNGTITATVDLECGEVEIAYDVFVEGSNFEPIITQINSACPNYTVSFEYTPKDAQSYVWNVSAGSIQSGSTSPTMTMVAPSGGAFIQLDILSACNYSRTANAFLEYDAGCGGGPFLISSNPTDEQLKISYNVISAEMGTASTYNVDILQESALEYEVQLLNNQQQIVKVSPITNEPVTNINVKDLQDGLYFLNIITGDNIFKKKILID